MAELNNHHTKAEGASKTLDTLKWLAVFLLIGLGIWANLYYSNQPLSVRLAGWIVLLLPILGIAFQTRIGRQVWRFLGEARTEMRKVVWPTRQDTVQTTLVVLAMVVIVSLMLWGIDSVLLWAIGMITGHAG